LLHRLEELGLKRLSAQSIRYPTPGVTLRELTGSEIRAALETLGEWTVVDSDIPGREPKKRVEFYKAFEFSSFEDAMAFMAAAVPKISEFDHHPRWENIWCTVSVWLSTWDIGHRPS